MICGPHMHNQQDLLRILTENALIEMVWPEDITTVVEKYVEDSSFRNNQGEKGFALMQENQGAKDVLWEKLQLYW